MQKWEYRIDYSISDDNLKEWLMIAGREGWELTAMIVQNIVSSHHIQTAIYELVFKRPIPEKGSIIKG